MAYIKNNLSTRLNIEIKKLNFMKNVESLERDEIFGALEEIEEQARKF